VQESSTAGWTLRLRVRRPWSSPDILGVTVARPVHG